MNALSWRDLNTDLQMQKNMGIHFSLTIAAVKKLGTYFLCVDIAKMLGVVKSHCRRMAGAKQEGHIAAR